MEVQAAADAEVCNFRLCAVKSALLAANPATKGRLRAVFFWPQRAAHAPISGVTRLGNGTGEFCRGLNLRRTLGLKSSERLLACRRAHSRALTQAPQHALPFPHPIV